MNTPSPDGGNVFSQCLKNQQLKEMGALDREEEKGDRRKEAKKCYSPHSILNQWGEGCVSIMYGHMTPAPQHPAGDA